MAKKRKRGDRPNNSQPPQEPNPGGRPTLLTPEVQDEIVRHLLEGNPYSLSCELAGISAATAKEWLSRGNGNDPGRPDTEPFATFATAVQYAKSRAERDRVKTVVESAQGRRVLRTKVVTKTYYDREGNEVTETTNESMESIQSDWHAARYLLERMNPARWGSNQMSELQAWQVLIEAGQVPAGVIDALLAGEEERRSRIQAALKNLE